MSRDNTIVVAQASQADRLYEDAIALSEEHSTQAWQSVPPLSVV